MSEQSKALRLANEVGELVSALRRTPLPLSTVIPHMQSSADELRRLYAINAELVEALQEAVSEYERLPHSLGYEFTHLPNMRAALKKANE